MQVANKKRINLSEMAIADKPFHWQTEYFSDQDIDRIIKESGVPLEGLVRVGIGRREEISRKELLKRELNGIAGYWRGMMQMRMNVNKNELPTVVGPYPKRTKADYLFDYLVFELGTLWTDHRIFQQEKVGASIAGPETQARKIRDGKARGPFIRFVNERHAIGMLTGPLSNDISTLDLDGFDEEMHAIADKILPPTGLMAGRGIFLKRHRNYRIIDKEFSDDLLPKPGTQTRAAMDAGTYRRFPGKQAFKGERNGKKFAIEILGAGNQAVIPPSFHPSGEKREWYGGTPGKPAEISYAELVSASQALFIKLGGKLKDRRPQVKRTQKRPENPVEQAPPVFDALPPKQEEVTEQQFSVPAGICDPEVNKLLSLQATSDQNDFENFKLAVQAAGIAIDGQHGNARTFYVCCLAGDYNIPFHEAWSVIQEWNKHNLDPWNENELKQKLWNSYMNGRSSPVGCKSITSDFMEYGASSVANARIFCERHYPSEGLINYLGDYYEYAYPIWRIIPEGIIENAAQREFEGRLIGGGPVGQSHINNVIRAVRNRAIMPKITKNPCWLDSERDTSGLIVAKNIVVEINIKNGLAITTIPHSKSLFCLSCLPFDYEPNASCPTWLEFLSSIWDNSIDNINLLQEWFGYNLISSYQWQNIMLLIGASRGGKGIIGHILREIVGLNASCGFTLNSLIGDFGLQDVYDKRAAILGDAQAIDRNRRELAKGLLLSISGADPLPINRKNKPIITSVVSARLTLLANQMPPFMDSAGALSNRLLVLPFYKSFAGKEDHLLLKKLLPECPGIFNWAIRGLERLVKNGIFTQNVSGLKYLQEIRRSNNPVGAFREDCCEYPCREGFEPSESLYDGYRQYMFSINRKSVLDKNAFLSALRTEAPELEKTQRRVGGVPRHGYANIRLRPESSWLNISEFLKMELSGCHEVDAWLS